MGRSSSLSGVDDTQLLFPAVELPLHPSRQEPNFRSLERPVWTEEKARLIQAYLRLFTFITKHGTYIDGFAAPQRRDMAELCSARLVLETEPKWIRDFWLCDLNPTGVEILEAMASRQRSKTRRVEVLLGDFNRTVDRVLASSRITAKTATFALLDQRTFECEWETVRRIAAHKPSLGPCDTKIEIFYFLATGWLDRSIAAVRRPDTSAKLGRWWGRADWAGLRDLQSIPRANIVAARFRDELGYGSARAYAIHSRKQRGRTMYHMIHATDHQEAPTLMLRAYRQVSGRAEIDLMPSQVDMEELWREVEGPES